MTLHVCIKTAYIN